MRHNSLKSPGGIGVLHSTHSLCSTTGMSTGRKKSLRKWPCWVSFQANALFWRLMKWCIRSCSPGHRKLPGWTSLMHSWFSAVYHPVGWNGGGVGESAGMSARGSLMMLQFMWNFSGKSVRTGHTSGYNKVCGEVKRVCDELESFEDLGTLIEQGASVLCKR